MRRCLYTLALTALLAPFVHAGEPASLADVLGRPDRWAQVSGLRDWQAPLDAADIDRLKEFVAGQREKDWVLYSLGQRLLRRSAQERAPAEIEKAEQILLGVAWESDISVFYQRDDAAELVKLGPAVVPLLKEVIGFEGLPDSARRLTAIKALTSLGDASLVPFLKEHLTPPKWPDYGSILLLILRLEPTTENADFAVDICASNKWGRPALGGVMSSDLPLELRMRVLKRTLESPPEGQPPLSPLAYLEDLDSPEAFQSVSDILLQHDAKTWDLAVTMLQKMHAGDPLPVFLAALETTPLEENRAFFYFIRPLVAANYRDSIPALQQRRAAIAQRRAQIEGTLADLGLEAGTSQVRSAPQQVGGEREEAAPPPRPFDKILFDMEVEVEKDLELQRRDIELAAGLAALGVDYDANALQVRQALGNWDTWKVAFGVAGLLHDDASVDELCRLLLARDPWPQVYHAAAQAARNPKEGEPNPRQELFRNAVLRLGEIGSVRAHDALVKAVSSSGGFGPADRDRPMRCLEDVGRALRNIGKANNRPDIQLEGEDFIAIAQYIWYMSRPRTEPYPLPAPESGAEQELARRAQAAGRRQPRFGSYLTPSNVWVRSMPQRPPPQ